MKQLQKVTGIALVVVAMTASVLAAGNSSNVMISADRMTYDGTTGRAEVHGNVVITKDDKTMTGADGWYDVHQEEASLTGGVSLIGDTMSMVADSLHSRHQTELEATGNVHLQKDNRQVFGDSVIYHTDTAYGIVSGNGRLVVDDATLTADYIEGWLNEIRAEANGSVTLSSPSRHMSATADSATYTQTPGQDDGVAYLTGNARAIQQGNVLNAPALKLAMKDNSAETVGGRSTLIIAPR